MCMHIYTFLKLPLLKKEARNLKESWEGLEEGQTKEKKRKVKQECWFDNLLSF